MDLVFAELPRLVGRELWCLGFDIYFHIYFFVQLVLAGFPSTGGNFAESVFAPAVAPTTHAAQPGGVGAAGGGPASSTELVIVEYQTISFALVLLHNRHVYDRRCLE